jgi:hypothetical protein
MSVLHSVTLTERTRARKVNRYRPSRPVSYGWVFTPGCGVGVTILVASGSMEKGTIDSHGEAIVVDTSRGS